MSKMLVAYFSATGKTRHIAEELAGVTGADLFEIRPEIPYSKADLNWRDVTSRSSREMRDKAFRPPMAEASKDTEPYDVIFLGFPIWWYIAPTIINTFLESTDLDGKRVILFATSGGSDFGETLPNLKVSVNESVSLEEGRVIKYTRSPRGMQAWLYSLGLELDPE